MQKIIKSSQKNREAIIDFFENFLRSNSERAKSMGNLQNCVTNGCFFNFNSMILNFCLPFINSPLKFQPKIEKININYLKQSQIYKDYEFINTELGEGEKNIEEEIIKNEEFSFITSIFFIGIKSLSLAGELYKRYLKFLENLSNLQRNSPKPNEDPTFMTAYAQKFCYDIQLFDGNLIETIFKFYSCNCIFLLNKINISIDVETLEFNPIKHEILPNKDFSIFPLFFFEQMEEFFMSLRQSEGNLLSKNISNLQICVNFMSIIAGFKNLMTNPHLKAKFFIFISTLLPEEKSSSFSSIFTNNAILEDYLVLFIINVFCEVEKTGSSEQFFEKFNYR